MLATLVWLGFVISSCKRLPHELRDGSLVLRLGKLKKVAVSLDEVAEISSSIEPAVLKAKGTKKSGRNRTSEQNGCSA